MKYIDDVLLIWLVVCIILVVFLYLGGRFMKWKDEREDNKWN